MSASCFRTDRTTGASRWLGLNEVSSNRNRGSASAYQQCSKRIWNDLRGRTRNLAHPAPIAPASGMLSKIGATLLPYRMHSSSLGVRIRGIESRPSRSSRDRAPPCGPVYHGRTDARSVELFSGISTVELSLL